MLLGLIAALGAALAFGIAAVLQAISARRVATSAGLDPLLLLRLLREWHFLVAVALNLGGFLLHMVALRSLPLFLVQVAISSSVAVTAVLAARVVDARMRGVHWGAVVLVCLGLALLAGGAGEVGTMPEDSSLQVGVLVALPVLMVVGSVASRFPGAVGSTMLGLVAGAGFGVVAVAARILESLRPSALLTDVTAYALAAAGVLAFLLYSLALQRGSATTAAAAVVVTQTVVPAVVGLVLLGDSVRSGWWPPAVLGLLLALVGAAVLTWFDESELEHTPSLLRPARAPAGAFVSGHGPGLEPARLPRQDVGHHRVGPGALHVRRSSPRGALSPRRCRRRA